MVTEGKNLDHECSAWYMIKWKVVVHPSQESQIIAAPTQAMVQLNQYHRDPERPFDLSFFTCDSYCTKSIYLGWGLSFSMDDRP